MYLTDLMTARDMIRFRNTQPSEEWIREQDRRLEEIYKEYTFLLMNEAVSQGWNDTQTSEALRHALIAISSIDYVISKATAGLTQ
jgi:hypothetical protein